MVKKIREEYLEKKVYYFFVLENLKNNNKFKAIR